MVAATTGAAVSPTVPAANTAAADHSSRFRPSASSQPRRREPGDHAAGRERRQVQPADRVAEAELVAQVWHHHAR